MILSSTTVFGYTPPKDTCEQEMRGKFIHVKTEASSLGISATWFITSVDLMQNVEVFRQEPGNERFKKLDAPASFFARNDSVFTVFIDKDVEPYQWYSYYLVPVDFCDDEGVSTDTITVASIAKYELPVAEKINVEGVSSSRSLELSWDFNTDVPIKASHVFMAENVEGPYEFVTTVNGSTTMLEERVSRANENYFFYVVAETPFGFGPRSGIAFGHFVGEDTPEKPQGIAVAIKEDVIAITWIPGESYVTGYNVYRKDGADDTWRNISGLITGTHYADDSEKEAMRTYSYAVAAVSDGFLESEKSEIKTIRTKEKDVPAPKVADVLTRGSSLHFVWDTYVMEYSWIKDCYLTLIFDDGTTYDMQINAPANSYLLEEAEGLEEATLYFQTINGLKSESVAFILPKTAGKDTGIELSGLHAMKSDDGVFIGWNSVAGISQPKYRVYRESDSSEPQVLGTTETCKYIDNNAQKGITYGYSVAFVLENGKEGKRSEPVVVVY